MEYSSNKRPSVNRARAVENSSLVRKIYSGFKSAFKSSVVYAPLIAASLALPSPSLAQTRDILTEEYFTGGIITKNYLAEDTLKWEIDTINEKLQVKDFDEKWGDTKWSGYTRFSIVDESTLLKMIEKNASIEAEFEVSEWVGSLQEVGFSIGDPTMLKNGTYYMIGMNAHPGVSPPKTVLSVARLSPEVNYTYFSEPTNLLAPGDKKFKMKFSHDSNGYHLFANDIELNADLTAQMNLYLPSIEGYPILTIYDSSSGANTSTTTTFDNVIIESDAPIGGGGSLAPKRIRKNLTQKLNGEEGRPITPDEIPHRFTRGDSNMDNSIDLSDTINTLQYCFLGAQNVRCPDAADINDDGIVDLSDAIFSLYSLFVDPSLNIPQPNSTLKDGNLIPNSAKGIDTTEDKLPPCEGY